MKYLLVIWSLFYNLNIIAQSSYSIRDNYGFEASRGLSVIELDSTYGTFGYYVREWTDKNYGIYYAEFSKKNGSLEKIIHFHDDAIWFEFNENNVITKTDTSIQFISAPNSDVHLVSISIEKGAIQLKTLPKLEFISYAYLKDVILHNNNKIIASSITYNNSKKSQLCLSFEENNGSYAHLLLGDTINFYVGSGPLLILPNNNILASSLATRITNQKSHINFYEIDSLHKVINQYTTPNNFSFFSISRMLLTNKNVIAFSTYKVKVVDQLEQTIPVIVFYDYKKAQLIKVLEFNQLIYNSWDTAYKNLKYAHDGNIIYGGEYTYYIPEKDQRNQDVVIGKIDTLGNELWRKRYTILEPVINDATFYHWLHDLEPTSDGNYICYGEVWGYTEEAGKPVNEAWLFKIDENGDIVNIDTTSTSTWVEKPDLPITIYPNPATDVIYINQNQVSDVQYEIVDLHGKLMQTIDSKDANHSYALDISHFTSGMYFIKIVKDNEVQGVLRFVKQL